MRNLKISKKLALGFGTLLIFLLVSTAFALFSLSSIAKNLDFFYNFPFQNSLLAVRIEVNANEAAKNMLHSIVTDSTTETNDRLNQASTDLSEILSSLSVLETNYTGDQADVSTVKTTIDELQTSFSKFSSLARTNDVTGAFAIYESEILPELTKIANAIAAIQTHANNVASENHNSGMMNSRITIVIMIVIGVVAIIIGAVLALTITRLLTGAVRELKNVAVEMGKGNFDVVVEYQSRDELGELSHAIRKMTRSLQTVVQDINHQLSEVANGNLTVKSEAENQYVGSLQPILQSIHKLTDDLNNTMLQIRQSADQVNAGSDQVSSAAQALAQGATEQASSVEELAATINDISQHINATADHAKTAKEENIRAHDELEVCSNYMNELVAAMTVIEGKSSEVSNVIKTIEDIAFQTNILALNAAVEAARAGSAGKGFAVVADEVRNLATKSQEAAKSTTTLIEETVRAVSEGTRLSGETESSLKAVIGNAQNVLTSVSNIATAAGEQALAVSQVTQGIDQISSVVQTNSATAEESAAASEELSSQAQMLKDLISVFHLDDAISLHTTHAGPTDHTSHISSPAGHTDSFGHFSHTSGDKY